MTCASCSVRAEFNGLSKRLAHDLRAPLRALTNIPTWIREDLEKAGGPLPPDIVEHFDMIEAQSKRMDQLIVGLVEFVAAASGEDKIEVIDAEHEITGLLGSLATGGNHSVSIASGLKEIFLSRQDFNILFGQLISNAIRHCGDNTSLCVRGSLEGPLALFEVEDNGPGIASEHQDRIFAPFETLKPSDLGAGSGLGLATAHKIIAAWGGSISVTDACPSGSIFKLQFPMAQSPHSQA